MASEMAGTVTDILRSTWFLRGVVAGVVEALAEHC